MTSLTVEEPPAICLSRALTRVAGRPDEVQRLHQVLRQYCHQARNVLNCLQLSLYLARRFGDPGSPVDWAGPVADYEGIERFVDRLQYLCRPIALTMVRHSIGLLFEQQAAEWSARLGGCGRRLILAPPEEPVVGGFDPSPFQKVFSDLVAWRCRDGSPQTDLRVSWTGRDGAFVVTWDEPRHRRKALPKTPGVFDGVEHLAMPLLTRVVSLHGGDLSVSESPRWRIRLSWPLDVRVP